MDVPVVLETAKIKPTSSSLGPISINCSSAHSTTSPNASPNTQVGLLTTAEDPSSPQEDDISVTASPTPSPQPPPAFPGVPPPPIQNNQLFNNALAASFFLNAPLLPPPGQWFYSQLYPHDWSWMGLRNNAALPRNSPQEDNFQNPDSSSEKLDVTEVDEESKDVKEFSKDSFRDSLKDAAGLEKNIDEKCGENEKKSFSEGINLSLRVRKAAITLVRQKDEVSSSDKDDLKCNNRNVWRPY
ncbi:hypothetical protein NQ315_005775 [Exocentrus adspersus]|uniref:Uncharacterized protein n=1 Tax=Exocentrus adspersus TaxID=1586481 RepID=A0AAV8VRM0_9CUCU|nr:hypothetical protein NQ315_005775 [Exocentrus adspersus]